mmetsp:Transcript_120261/g.345728  ORF Transcript_120261/g.345728 Transcript_120261/m.345728 type:complete len:224 (+) Transcript_120261:1368-2039(+)
MASLPLATVASRPALPKVCVQVPRGRVPAPQRAAIPTATAPGASLMSLAWRGRTSAATTAIAAATTWTAARFRAKASVSVSRSLMNSSRRPSMRHWPMTMQKAPPRPWLGCHSALGTSKFMAETIAQLAPPRLQRPISACMRWSMSWRHTVRSTAWHQVQHRFCLASWAWQPQVFMNNVAPQQLAGHVEAWTPWIEPRSVAPCYCVRSSSRQTAWQAQGRRVR